MVLMPKCCGLFHFGSDRINVIPLTKCVVKAFVRDAVAQVVLEQTFVNSEAATIEATYLFPIHPAGAVNQFEVTLHDGRKFVGVCKNKAEARREYEAAVERGDGAYLLEQTDNSHEIFRSSVGNLKAGEQVTVAIGYVTIVDNDEEADSLRFVVPTTIAPRYRPVSLASGEAAAAAASGDGGAKQTEEAEYAVAVPYTISIDVKFELSGSRKFRSVKSASHSISTALNEKRNEACVTLTSGCEQLDRDIVVVAIGEDLDEPVVVVEKMKETGSVCAMLSFVPRFEIKEQKCEVVFLIDTSGSMGGFKIQQAKEALKLLLRSLPVDCYFNVYEFNSSYSSLFDHSVKYTQDGLRSALDFVGRLNASGGTELLGPFKKIFSKKPIDGYKSQLLILTDGEVSNVQELVSRVSSNANHCRVFTLGVGNAVSHELVEGMAKAGNGTTVYIMENESFSRKVVQQLQRALQPAFTNLKVEWSLVGDGTGDAGDTAKKEAAAQAQESATATSKQELSFFVKNLKEDPKVARASATRRVVKRAPFVSPPVFKGSRYTAFAIGNEESFVGDQAVISGVDDAGRTFRLPVRAAAHESDATEEKGDNNDQIRLKFKSVLHAAAARRLIEELESESSYLHAEAGYTRDEVNEAIECIALEQNLASSRTAFVCIEERESVKWRQLSVREKRNVPIVGDKHGGDVPSVSFVRSSGVLESVGLQLAAASCMASSDAMLMKCAAPRSAPKSKGLFSGFGFLSKKHSSKARSSPDRQLESTRSSPPRARMQMAMAMTADMDMAMNVDVDMARSFERSTTSHRASLGDTLQTLLEWQLFDGSFVLSDDLCTFIVGKNQQVTLEVVDKFFDSESVELGKDEWVSLDQKGKTSAVATLLALGYLTKHLSGRKAEWDLIADKAVSFLVGLKLKKQSRSQYECLANKLLGKF